VKIGPRILVCLALLTLTNNAGAFCRLNTKPSLEKDYRPNVSGCFRPTVSGSPLYWSIRSIAYEVQVDPAIAETISLDDARAMVKRSFDKWLGVRCKNGKPPPTEVLDATSEATPEKPTTMITKENKCDLNIDIKGRANIIRFANTTHPTVVGVTCPIRNVLSDSGRNGEIAVSTVEIRDLAKNNASGADKLLEKYEYTVLHELGHFLGMGHSDKDDAVMYAEYDGSLTNLELKADDMAGICDIYNADAPPGFGCNVAEDREKTASAWAFVPLLAAFAARILRKRGRSSARRQ
jgi:Matrixin